VKELPPDEDWILAHSQFILESTSRNPIQILDLGSGAGRDSFYLCDFGDVVSADLNFDSLVACRSHAQRAKPVCFDLSHPFPFADNTFDFVLASLSLHYFSWTTTELAVQELRRCLDSCGRSIIRLNSTNDLNYGADSTDVIEQNYFNVGNQQKRFFSQEDIRELFDDWYIESISELEISRYKECKVIWEAVLRAA